MDRIKFENISDDGAMANGTSLQGYLRDITTRQLTEMFGEPNMVPSGDGKVTSEWIIKTEITDEDGDIESGLFTLYDWKGSRPYDDNALWTINVGGKSQHIYDFAKKSNKKVKKSFLKKNAKIGMPFDSSISTKKLKKILK